jgi:hypothetical protein
MSTLSTVTTTTTTTKTNRSDELLHVQFQDCFFDILSNMKMLNKKLNQNMLYLELDPERNSQNILSIAEALAKENDKVRMLLTALKRHQSEYTIVANMKEKRNSRLQSVRETLNTIHRIREALAHVTEEVQPEADAAKKSAKRPLPVSSILQLSKRVRYTSSWPIHHDLPPPNNKKNLPPPHSEPAPQEDHMKHFSLLFNPNKYLDKKEEVEQEEVEK